MYTQENAAGDLQQGANTNSFAEAAAAAAAIAEEDGDIPPDVPTLSGTKAAQGILGRKNPYCLRAHVFQCRGLPSSEASGLLDPYIKVRGGGVGLGVRPAKTIWRGGRLGYPAYASAAARVCVCV